jgi:hypothetical protein
MAEFSYPWEGEDTGDAGPYSSEQWALAWRTLFNGALSDQDNVGVILSSGDGLNSPLLVAETASPSTQVRVYPGSALVNGRFYISDDTELITIPGNGTADDRIDRLVLRNTFADQETRLTLLPGTPAAVPVPPTLVQSGGVFFDIPVAQIFAESGFLSIEDTDITDEREPVTISTNKGGTGISSFLDPYIKGDLLAALSAEVLTQLAVGATDGMRLAVDASQAAGVKWVNSRPSLVANNSGGASVAVTTANLIFDTIVSDGPGNISSINGSGYVIPSAGTYKVRGSVSWTHTVGVTTAIGQLVLYDNNAAANVSDVTGAVVLSNGNNLINGVVGGGTAEFPEHICTFVGTEQLSYRIATGFGTNSAMRRTKNPILVLERIF